MAFLMEIDSAYTEAERKIVLTRRIAPSIAQAPCLLRQGGRPCVLPVRTTARPAEPKEQQGQHYHNNRTDGDPVSKIVRVHDAPML